MSLASVLFESAYPSMTSEDIGRYNYADGHRAIYAETAMELRDVFEATFYASNQVELQAIHEGTSVDESYEYQEVMENIITNGFQRLTEVAKRLWGKIVEFFIQIKNKLLTMTRDNEKFVEKFNDLLKGKTLNLAGFKYMTYVYTNLDDFESLLTSSRISVVNDINKEVNAKCKSDSLTPDEQNDLGNALDRAYKKFLKDMTGTDDESDVHDAMYAHFRSGARPGDDKTQVAVTSLDPYLNAIKSSKSVKAMDAFKKSVDTEFTNLVKAIKTQEKDCKQNGSSTSVLDVLRKQVKQINKIHSKANSFISIWRQATQERVGTYRNLCHAAVAYSGRRK